MSNNPLFSKTKSPANVLWPGNMSLQSHFVALFMCLGMAIPQFHTFGFPVGFAFIYIEELFLGLLITITLVGLIWKGKFSKNGFILLILWVFLVLIGFARAVQFGNNLTDILRDLRIPICYLCLIPLIINLRLRIGEVRYVIKAACVGIAVFTILDLISLATNSLLMNFRNEKMVAGLGNRLVYGNEIIPVFMMPLMIWGFRNKLWSGRLTGYVIFVAIILTFIAYKRTLLGLWIIALVLTGLMGLRFKRKLRFFALIILCTIVFVPFFLNTKLYERISGAFEGVEGSYQVRMFAYATNAVKILDHPLVGHGFGARMLVSLKGVHGQGHEHTFVDNSYITVLYKVGILGFVLWLTWLYVFFTKLESEKGIILIYVIMWALFAVFSAYISNTNRTICYLIFIMLLVRDVSRHLREKVTQ